MTPALGRVKAMLFRPFRFTTWIKLGFIGWLAGELAGANFNFSMPMGPGGAPPHTPGGGDFPMAMIAVLVAVAFAVFLVIALVFVYLFSRFRFVLFDCVVSGEALIGRGWHGYRAQAHRYLGFLVVLALVSMLALSTVVGLPILYAYKQGVFAGKTPSMGPMFAMIGVLVTGVLLFAIVAFVVSTLVKDFFVPMLALDDLSISDAWAALRHSIMAEPAAYAGYIGMKLVLTMAASIIISIVVVLLVLLLVVPAVVIVVLGAALAKSVGAVGMAVLGTAALVGALLVAGAVFCATLLCTAPIAVFFQSYSLYFFGGRYPKLGALIAPGMEPNPQPGHEGLGLAPAT